MSLPREVEARENEVRAYCQGNRLKNGHPKVIIVNEMAKCEEDLGNLLQLGELHV